MVRPEFAPKRKPCWTIGFYNIVTQTEAERWEQNRQEREALAREFQHSVVEQYRARGKEPPPILKRSGN